MYSCSSLKGQMYDRHTYDNYCFFKSFVIKYQGIRKHGCGGCMNLKIFGTSHFAPTNFEDFSTIETRKL